MPHVPGAPPLPPSTPPAVAEEPRPAPTPGRPSWKAVADAVGCCVLVFTFAPALLALPGWLRFEFRNTANLHEPLILLFAPIRGFLSLLDAFQLGAASGAAVGCLQGLMLSAWSQGHGDMWRRRFVLGAASGALAAGLVAVLRPLAPFGNGAEPLSAQRLAFEVASGLVFGLFAAPAALRLLKPLAEAKAHDHAPAILP